MDLKVLAATASLVGIVATSSFTPTTVYAQDALVITGIATGAYLGTVFIGGAIYHHTWGRFAFAPQHSAPPRKEHREGLQLAHRCPQTSGNLTLLCW